MINRKRSNFIDHSWVLSENPFSSNNIFSSKKKIKIKISPHITYANSQYIMHELKKDHVFITCINPIGHIIKNKLENTMRTNSFIVEESYNLSEVNTWLQLWDMDVEMVEYRDNILKYLSANDCYVSLAWYIDKIRQIKKDDFDKIEAVKIILKEAVRNNNYDIIQYIAVEFGNDFSYLSNDSSIIESICALAAMQNVNKDYCIKTIQYLDNYKFFSGILYPDRMLKMISILFKEMGHKKCSDIINKYLHNN